MAFAVEVGDVRLNGEHVESWDGKYWVFREVAPSPIPMPRLTDEEVAARNEERRLEYVRREEESRRLIAEADAAERAQLEALVGARLVGYERQDDDLIVDLLTEGRKVRVRVGLNYEGCSCCDIPHLKLSIEGTE